MAELGSADLVIVPKFKGLSEQVDKALGAAEPAASKSGEKVGSSVAGGFGGGLAKSGAVIGAFSAMTAKAMDAVSSHVGSAVARFDTMNAFPAVMQSLGYSSKDSEAAIAKLSDRLGSLPTTLDSMTGAVQRLVPSVKDVGRATDIMLAFNDAVVAGKAPVEVQQSAIEQFSQAVSRGKFELEEWRSVQTAMPGQMDQLAKSMLGATASTGDLYEALKDGSVSMDDFLAQLVRLDTEGGPGFMSFKEQAETAAGGVSTSMANMGNAFTKGIAKIMDTVGEKNITGVFDGVKTAVNRAFDAVNGALGKAMPTVEKVGGALADIAPQAVTAAAAFAGFKVAAGHLSDFAGRAKEAKTQSGLLEKAGTLLGRSFSPASLAITAVSAALGVAVSAFVDAKAKVDNFRAATEGVDEAVSKLTSLDDYSKRIAGVGESAGVTAKSVDEVSEHIAKNAEKMNELATAAQDQIAKLSTAQGIINDYAGKTDLSADAQGRLEWAIKLVNDQFDLSITKADVMADSYTDADGAARDLTDSVNGLVDAKKKEIEMNALTEALTAAYEDEAEATRTLAKARKDYNADVEEATRQRMEVTGESYEQAKKEVELTKEGMTSWQEYSEALEIANDQVEAREDLEAKLGDESKAVSENADAWDAWGNQVSGIFEETLKLAVGENGLGMLKDDLRDLGVDVGKFSELNEESLMRVADAYDGTAASIVGVLDELGFEMDEATLKTAEAAASIKEAFDGFGEGFSASLETAGVDLDTLAWKMAEAGVSTETLNQVGSANMAALAEATGGNIDQMIGFLQMYNSEPLIDKNGNVNVNDVQLVDAQGNVYTWNGTSLVDKNGNAAIEDTSVMDAQGHKLVWNGTNLQYKTADGRVYDFMSHGIAQRDSWNANGLKDWEGTGTINIFKNITETVSRIFTRESAAGGIRLHANGGIRPHASGAFIATKAMPLDIVGEDGAEAIVPLTNRKYSQPFADIIAEGVAGRMADDRPRQVSQVINVYQPVKSPSELAREMRRQQRYGLAASRE